MDQIPPTTEGLAVAINSIYNKIWMKHGEGWETPSVCRKFLARIRKGEK